VVLSATDRAERKVLSRFGAFVRTRARTSIRQRKGPSAPGQPPSSHTGLLKRNIFFVYDRARHSVLIGPILLNQKVGDAPRALEAGGWSRVFAGRGRRRRLLRTVLIRARPYMRPAYEQELPGVPALWKNAIRRAA
jgi:hypothetical protein